MEDLTHSLNMEHLRNNQKTVILCSPQTVSTTWWWGGQFFLALWMNPMPCPRAFPLHFDN